MARLYIRQASVVIGFGGGASITVDGLRIRFQINRSIKPSQASSVMITNLAAATATRIEEGETLRLTAGYRDGRSGILMLGAITDVDSRREGVDRTTTITMDVGKDRSELRFAQSYGAGATAHIVLQDIAAAMGLSLGDLAGIADEPLPYYAADLPVDAAMTAILRPLQTVATEVDGQLVFTPMGAEPGHSGTGAITVSEETGLVGSVTVTDKGVKCKMLLEPRAYPGTMMMLESEEVTGTYRITETINRGDSWGGEWVTEITAVRPGA